LRIAHLREVRIGRSCWIRQIDVPRNPWAIVIGNGVAPDDQCRTFDDLGILRVPVFDRNEQAYNPKRAAFDQ
jgi:hypothetical protein